MLIFNSYINLTQPTKAAIYQTFFSTIIPAYKYCYHLYIHLSNVENDLPLRILLYFIEMLLLMDCRIIGFTWK
jgi:hypothetical protein